MQSYDTKKEDGKWKGAVNKAGQYLCYWIIPESAVPIARTIVQSLADEEHRTPDVQRWIVKLDMAIELKIGDEANIWDTVLILIYDRVQPKMPPSISFSGTERKQFLLCRNRTNS